MADWKYFADIEIPEGLDEDEVFEYIKEEVLCKAEGKVLDYFIKKGLLRLGGEDEKKT